MDVQDCWRYDWSDAVVARLWRSSLSPGLLGPFLVSCALFMGGAEARAAEPDRPSAVRPLVIGLSQEFGSLNPLLTTASASASVRAFTNRDLVQVDSLGNWHADLAEGIPTVKAGTVHFEGGADAKTASTVAHWTLRANAAWGDGHPVTCQDVRFSWQLGRHPAVPVAARQAYEDITDVGCTADKPRAVMIRMKGRRADSHKLDGLKILPEHLEAAAFAELVRSGDGDAYVKATRYLKDPLNPGLYNGPFLPKEIKPGSHIVLGVNGRFFGTAPQLAGGLILRIVPESAALEAHLKSGAIDMIHAIGLGPEQISALRKLTVKESLPFRVVDYTGPVYEHIVFNLDDPALADVRVRRALLFGLDRPAMMKNLFEGMMLPAAHFGSPSDAWFAGMGSPDQSYAPRTARRLLAAAGFEPRPGDGRLVRNGQPLELTLVSTAGNSSRARVAAFLQEQWRHLGINVVTEFVPARVFFSEVVPRRQFKHMAMFAQELEFGEVPVALIDPRQVPAAQNGYAGTNYAGWRRPEIVDVLDEYSSSLDPVRRQEIGRKLTQLYAAELPHLPLYFRTASQVVPADLVNKPGLSYFSGLQSEYWKRQGTGVQDRLATGTKAQQ